MAGIRVAEDRGRISSGRGVGGQCWGKGDGESEVNVMVASRGCGRKRVEGRVF